MNARHPFARARRRATLTRAAALAAITTAMVAAALATAAPAGAAPEVNLAPAVDDGQVESAKLGITLYALDDLAETAEPGVCPALSLDEVTFILGSAGMVSTAIGYEVGAYAGDEPDTLTVYCGVDTESFIDQGDPAAPTAFRMWASTLDAGESTFQQFLDASIPGLVPSPVADPAIGGESVTRCGTPGRRLCYSAWHRNGLVIDFVLVAPPEQLDDLKANQLLLSMVDLAVNNLAAYTTAAVDTTLPPVTVPPVTAPPVTAAPMTVPAVTVPAVTTVPVPTPPSTAAPLPPTPTTAPAVTAPATTVAAQATTVAAQGQATTVDGMPLSAEQAAVLRGVLDAKAVALVAGAVPTDPGLAAAIDATYVLGSSAHDAVSAVVVTALADGTTATPSAEFSPRFEVESVTLVDGPPATSAILVACSVDSLVVVDATGTVVSNDLVASRIEYDVRLDGGAWKVFERTVLSASSGATSCDAVPAQPGATTTVPVAGTVPA